ncbi:hypothetical protein JIR001_18440 [Polycladomyces abyssicola]|uniref:Uncharacterized protein n=1 Tax=Polycladomyces abyssicola TaxID=1125966 RepID=A0A8D5UEP0_9BACL|nr:hypothetical protein JIR001_18440 [Polycladomyces abyssicola]
MFASFEGELLAIIFPSSGSPFVRENVVTQAGPDAFIERVSSFPAFLPHRSSFIASDEMIVI